MNEQLGQEAEDFKAEMLAIFEKYQVGIQGTMLFVIGEDQLVLSTRKETADGDCPEDCDKHGCGG